MASTSVQIKQRSNLYIILLLVIIVILQLISFEGFPLSDEYLYIKNSILISNNEFVLNGSVFNNRFGLLIPVGIIFKLFGYNDYLPIVWPLAALLILTIFSYVIFRPAGQNFALLISIIIGIHPLLTKQAAGILPDLVMLTFSTITTYCVYMASQSNKEQIRYALFFTVALFLAFISKETMVLTIPFYFVIFVIDIYNNKNYKFWLICILFSLAVFIAYFLTYFLVKGDPLFRFKGIEQEHNISQVWSYHGSAMATILSRITYEPLLFLVRNPYFFFLFVFSVPSIIAFKSTLERFFSSYLLFLLILFWFSSTSLKEYNPLPLAARMWILIIPPLAILTANSFYFHLQSTIQKIPRLYIIILLGILIIQILSLMIDKEPKILFSSLYSVIAIIIFSRGERKVSKKLNYILFFLPLLLFYTHQFYIKIYKKSEFKIEKELIIKNQNNDIITDPVLAKRYDIYLEFEKTNIKINEWASAPPNIGPDTRILINTGRLKTLEEKYHYEIPAWIKNAIINTDGFSESLVIY